MIVLYKTFFTLDISAHSAVAYLLCGIGLIVFYVLIRINKNKQYLIKPAEELLPTLSVLFVVVSVFCLIYSASVFTNNYSIAVYMQYGISATIFVAILTSFSFRKARKDIQASKYIQDEILTRYSIEDKLINKNKQLEWAERTAKICYGTWDLATDSIVFSDGAEDVLGVELDSVLTFEQLKAIIIPEDRIKLQRFLESANMMTDQITTLLLRVIIRSKLKYIQMYSEVIEEGNSVKQIRGTFQDVTEQEMFIKRIEDKNETLKEIAYTQSHDVRGPLATIMGLVDLLDLEEFKDPHNVEIINGLKQSTSELDDIIKKVVKKAEAADVDLS